MMSSQVNFHYQPHRAFLQSTPSTFLAYHWLQGAWPTCQVNLLYSHVYICIYHVYIYNIHVCKDEMYVIYIYTHVYRLISKDIDFNRSLYGDSIYPDYSKFHSGHTSKIIQGELECTK